MKYLIIAFIWIGYCALHSFLISIGFTKLMMRLLKKYYAYYRLFYVLFSVVLLFPVIRFSLHSDHEIIVHYSVFWSVIRHILISGSFMVFFWAFFFSYDSLSFFGIRQIVNMNKGNRHIPSHGIKRDKLLGKVRHPMYLAVIILLWCHTFTVSEILVNSILTLYIFIGSRLEERKLVMEFGDAYIRYQQEVPMLIPFIKKKPQPSKINE